MEIFCNGIARLRHSKTGRQFEIDASELDWDCVSSDERGMGPEHCYEATIEHPELGLLTWSLWEYPEGVENFRKTDVGGHEVLQDLAYGLEPFAESEQWVEDSPPSDPYAVYLDSYYRASDLLADQGSDRGDALLNRLIFAHHITALEAYLGDTLLDVVINRPAALSQLLAKDKDLLAEKFTLAEVAGDRDLVINRANEYLRSILYHNLPKVDFLYTTSMGFGLLDLVQDKHKLLDAIKLRHDCVHRNGRDKQGAVLSNFTKDYVQSIADLIVDLVQKVQLKKSKLV